MTPAAALDAGQRDGPGVHEALPTAPAVCQCARTLLPAPLHAPLAASCSELGAPRAGCASVPSSPRHLSQWPVRKHTASIQPCILLLLTWKLTSRPGGSFCDCGKPAMEKYLLLGGLTRTVHTRLLGFCACACGHSGDARARPLALGAAPDAPTHTHLDRDQHRLVLARLHVVQLYLRRSDLEASHPPLSLAARGRRCTTGPTQGQHVSPRLERYILTLLQLFASRAVRSSCSRSLGSQQGHAVGSLPRTQGQRQRHRQRIHS